jgi:hypothetical protein
MPKTGIERQQHYEIGSSSIIFLVASGINFLQLLSTDLIIVVIVFLLTLLNINNNNNMNIMVVVVVATTRTGCCVHPLTT